MIKEYPDLEGVMHPLDLDKPEPGIYCHVPMEEYLKIKAISRSSLKDFRECKETYGKPKEDKSYTILGTQYHTFTTEPELFDKLYFEYDGRRDMRHAAYAETVEDAGSPDRVYKPDDLKQMQDMLTMLQETYPRSYKWLTGKAKTGGEFKKVKNPPVHELTVIAICPITGFTLKIRIDTAWVTLNTIVDLKTTHKALPGPFKYNAKKFGNDLQPGFYCYVCSLNPKLKSVDNFYFVVQQTTDPYIVRRYPLREYDIDTDSEINPVPRLVEESKSMLVDLKNWLDAGKPIEDEPIFISF